MQPVVAGPAVSPLDTTSITGNAIRNVGSYTPVTTLWNAGDLWVDTLTTANTIRVWTGTAWSPARSSGAPLFADYFTGADAATVSGANWVVAANPVSGSGFGFTYLTNTGKLTSGTGNGVKISRSVNITNPADSNTACAFKFDSTTPNNFQIWARATASLDSQTGYSVTVLKGKNYVNKWNSYSATDFNVGGTTFAFAENTFYSIRLRVVGTSIQARVWVTAEAEPTTWGVSVTDGSIVGAGYCGITLLNASSGSSNVFFDNYVIDPA
jgi:hypothetical protein